MKEKPLLRFILLGCAFIFILAFLSVHIRIETTLMGYSIGRLKQKESALLKSQSLLKMKLAKITTKQNLLKIIRRKNN